MSDKIRLKMVNWTNPRIKSFLFALGFTHMIQDNSKKTQYGLTSLKELRVWFGLSYLRGALQLNFRDTDDVWYHGVANNIFTAAMQRK